MGLAPAAWSKCQTSMTHPNSSSVNCAGRSYYESHTSSYLDIQLVDIQDIFTSYVVGYQLEHIDHWIATPTASQCRWPFASINASWHSEWSYEVLPVRSCWGLFRPFAVILPPLQSCCSASHQQRLQAGLPPPHGRTEMSHGRALLLCQAII